MQLFGLNWVELGRMFFWRRRTLNGLRLLQSKSRFAWAAGTMFAIIFLMVAAAVSGFAQGKAMSPYQDEEDGVSAGGKWMQFRSEDKMTGAKKVRFELLSNNYLREDPDSKPRVELVCSNGKFERGDFTPGERLGHPDYPGFWGQPKMEVMVRIDGSHEHKGWNWVRGHFLAMDKGTVRGMIGAQVFNVEVRTRRGPQIAEFSPAALDLGEVRKSCDLTPHRP